MNGLLSKLLIALDISFPMVGDKCSSVGHRVEEGPESAVAAAIVVAIEEFRFRADRHDLKNKSNVTFAALVRNGFFLHA